MSNDGEQKHRGLRPCRYGIMSETEDPSRVRTFKEGPMRRRILVIFGVTICLALLAVSSHHAAASDARFEVSYPVGTASGPITGRVFVAISKNNRVEPRLQAGSYGGSVPFYCLDVHALKPRETDVIDISVLGS